MDLETGLTHGFVGIVMQESLEFEPDPLVYSSVSM